MVASLCRGGNRPRSQTWSVWLDTQVPGPKVLLRQKSLPPPSHFALRTGLPPHTQRWTPPAWHYLAVPRTDAGVGTFRLSDAVPWHVQGGAVASPETKRNLDCEDADFQRAEPEFTVAGFTMCCFAFVVLVTALLRYNVHILQLTHCTIQKFLVFSPTY